jgi:hydroxymethylpyrimidine pyrophosphatase-like HAD family hydrolase
VYVGDSLNDAPMFAAFPLSVGVANVRDVEDVIETKPKFITAAREGRGFEELARAILR